MSQQSSQQSMQQSSQQSMQQSTQKSALHTQPPTSAHIAVVGAGLLGRLIAWRLLCAGVRVSLYEAKAFTPSASAAYTAAAMISPLSEVVVSERSIYTAGMQSLQLWPQWIAELNQTAPQAIGYFATGSLMLAHPQDHTELLQFKQDLGFHLGADDRSQWLNAQQLAECEPALNHFHQALYLPGEAYLDHRELLQALLNQIRALGGTCYEHTPLNATQIAALPKVDFAIDCRGVGANDSLPNLRSVRGEVLWVHTTEVQLQHAIRLCHPRYKLYLVPKPNQQFIIGATEIESDDRSPISLQSMLELSSALYTIHPAFAEARVISSDVNLRPALPNNLPVVQQQDRVISVNGLYRHGYLLAPFLVEQVLERILPVQTSRQQV